MSDVKASGLTREVHPKLAGLSTEEGLGIPGVKDETQKKEKR